MERTQDDRYTHVVAWWVGVIGGLFSIVVIACCCCCCYRSVCGACGATGVGRRVGVHARESLRRRRFGYAARRARLADKNRKGARSELEV